MKMNMDKYLVSYKRGPSMKVESVKEISIATSVFLKQAEETLKHENIIVNEYVPLIRPQYDTTRLELKLYVLNDIAILHIEVPTILFIDPLSGIKTAGNFNRLKLDLLTDLLMEEKKNEQPEQPEQTK